MNAKPNLRLDFIHVLYHTHGLFKFLCTLVDCGQESLDFSPVSQKHIFAFSVAGLKYSN